MSDAQAAEPRPERQRRRPERYGDPIHHDDLRVTNPEKAAILASFYNFDCRREDVYSQMLADVPYSTSNESYIQLCDIWKKIQEEIECYLIYEFDETDKSHIRDLRSQVLVEIGTLRTHVHDHQTKQQQLHHVNTHGPPPLLLQKMDDHDGSISPYLCPTPRNNGDDDDRVSVHTHASKSSKSSASSKASRSSKASKSSRASSAASRASEASKARAEAMKARIRLTQTKKENELKRRIILETVDLEQQLETLKLQNAVDINETIARALEQDEYDESEVGFPTESQQQHFAPKCSPIKEEAPFIKSEAEPKPFVTNTRNLDIGAPHLADPTNQIPAPENPPCQNTHSRQQPLPPSYQQYKLSPAGTEETHGNLFKTYLPGFAPDPPAEKCYRDHDLAPPQNETRQHDMADKHYQSPPGNFHFSHEKSMRLMYLNSFSPSKFDGKPREYPALAGRLESLLNDGLLSEREKLEMLPKFLSSDPLQMLHTMQGRSYSSITSRLEERYGNPVLVTNDHIRELTSGPILSPADRKGLLSFADAVTTAAESLTGEYLVAASCIPNMEKIVNRLPNYLRNEWEKKVSDICQRSTPQLSDLAKFIDRAAKAKNNPYYQSPSAESSRNSNPRSQPPAGRAGVFSMPTDVKPARDLRFPCDLCGGADHHTWFCSTLKNAKRDERAEMIAKNGLCEVCFRKGCRTPSCPRRNQKFVCEVCKVPHHKLLPCRENVSVTSPQPSSPDEPTVDEDASPVVTHSTTTGHSDYMMTIVPVNVHGANGKIISIYAFLDSGSRASFIDESIAAELGISGPKQYKFVKTISGRRRQNMRKVTFTVSNIRTGYKAEVGYQSYSLMDTSLNKCLSDEHITPSSHDVHRYKHLQNLNLPVPDRPVIGVMLGLPVREAHEALGYVKGKYDEPYAIKTLLGIAIAGPMQSQGTEAPTLGCHLTTVQQAPPVEALQTLQDPLIDLLQRFWKFEDYGTDYDSNNALSPNDKMAIDRFYKTLRQLADGHYQSGLMWKNPKNVKIPYNRHIALAKHYSLLKKFENDPEFKTMYVKCMQRYIDNKWASLVPDDEIDLNNGKVCYLSHFGVTNPNKPGKVRAVFNAAEEYLGVSLNSLLLCGPDSSCSLLGVLLRARFGKYCVASDVRDMFNECFVSPEDRDALRFLWIDEHNNIRDFRMNIHIFGAVDSPFCANRILKQIGKDNVEQYEPEIIAAIDENFYVDDSMITAGSSEKMVKMAVELKSALSKGRFELAKFISNDKNVLRALNPTDWVQPSLNLDLDPLPIERVLGLQWNVERDCFMYKIIKIEQPDTMRGMTSAVARLFDPIGATAPVTLVIKQLIQECWRRKKGWDEDLDTDLSKKWTDWKRQFHLLSKLEIPRPYFPKIDDCRDPGIELQLHCFADSSGYATGSVAYLRAVDPKGDIHVGFVIGKAKLLPLHPVLYVPKGEMKAAVDLVRIGKKLEVEMKLTLNPTTFWTDSEIVLKYIKNESKTFQPFIANRRSEIRAKSDPNQWRFCRSKMNPSDEASRGIPIRDYHSGHRFLTGPDFLHQNEQNWPSTQLGEITDDDPQIKKSAILVTTTSISDNDQIGKLILRHSSLRRLARTAAWTLRFCSNAAALVKQNASRDTSALSQFVVNAKTQEGSLTVLEVETAEKSLIRYVQENTWPAELAAIRADSKISRKSQILKLNPFIADGLLRVGGRISRAPLDYNIRHPIILPSPARVCHLSSLILTKYHLLLLHGGAEMTLAKSREKYWILYAKSFTRTLVTDCVTCKRRNTQPVRQLMADLPSDRLTINQPVYTHTGTDCFGPLLCKVGRRRDMRFYGVLYLCLNTKAIHLELVKSLNTEDFIQSLMRFCALHPVVKDIRSDNGSNYIGAEKELRQLVRAWNKEQICEKMRVKGIEWTFQLPYASSMSGVWERKVKESKRHIYAVLKTYQLDPDGMRTFLYEVANVINQTPLCSVSDDPHSFEVLTPAHFLFQCPATNLTPVPTFFHASYYRKVWRQIQSLMDVFWKRYVNSVTPSLQIRPKWLKSHPNLNKNDLVLLTHMDLPRSRWVTGRVMETFPGQDGLVRTVKVKTKDGEYMRPIQRLALISPAIES